MHKNHRIEARVNEDTKKALLKKAESYGGLTRFFEELAKKLYTARGWMGGLRSRSHDLA